MKKIKKTELAQESIKPAIKRAAKAAYRKNINPIGNAETGYTPSNGGVLVPNSMPISANKLQAGIDVAHDQITKTIRKLANLFGNDLFLSEVELTLGFDANGKFIGFGASAHFNIKIKVKPSKND